MLLIKNANVFAPNPLGVCDILVAAERIIDIQKHIDAPAGIPCDMIDAGGRIVIPGLIDAHVHLTGGGGEGGYHTRTPELTLSGATMNGVTTVVGVLGTDGVARSLESLVAKVYALREEGLSAWCYTGSYRFPVKTITGDVSKDIMMIDPIIGAGELAISDHRSSKPSDAEICRVATEARVAGMLSGKAGIVNVHLGDAPSGFSQLERIISDRELPRTQFLPTHCNRNPELMLQASLWLQAGGNADFTASSVPGDGESSAAGVLSRLTSDGQSLANVTVTSDGQGSLPRFDLYGALSGLDVGTCSSLLVMLREACIRDSLPLECVLAPISANPARILKLSRKGRLEPGADADIVIMNEGFVPATVIARGAIMVLEGKPVKLGTFETGLVARF